MLGFTSSFETQRESKIANTAASEEEYAPTHQPTSDSATPDPRDQAISDLQQKVAALQASLDFKDKSGTSASANHVTQSQSSTSWILDSGASDHMTGKRDGFLSYSPISSGIRLADGSLSSASGIGISPLSSSLSIPNVVHVSTFPSNLLSVSQLTKQLSCSITFFPSNCVFQDLRTS